MASNGSFNTTVLANTNPNYTTSFSGNRTKFIVLLLLQLLSIPRFIWLFHQFAYRRDLRRSQRYHVILLILIISFLFVTIALPLSQAYMFRSFVYPSSNLFCSWWIWLHYSLNITNLFLMAFASIERNWLIFHPWLVTSNRGKILFHYCPLLFCLLYPSMFFYGVIFLYRCRSYYDFTQLLCKWPCYFYNDDLANFDLFFNNCAPMLTIPCFCVMIYVRMLIQRRAMKQRALKWIRAKKMIVQLCAISSLYLGMWMPTQLSGLINIYWDPTFLLQAQIDYMYLFPYLIHLVYPFIVFLPSRRQTHAR